MTDPRCGSTAGYSAHRRRKESTCPACRAAAAAYEHRRQARAYITGQSLMVDATGTRRRIRALMRVGWSLHEIARRLDTYAQSLSRAHRQAPLVKASTAAKVSALYDELSMIPGPSEYARRYAADAGWPPPLAWDDDEIDDPATKPAAYVPGAPGRPRNTDLDERILELTRAGLSAAEICVRLGTYKRHVTRVRARNRQEGAA